MLPLRFIELQSPPTKPLRIAENIDVFYFELSTEQLAAIDALDTVGGVARSPSRSHWRTSGARSPRPSDSSGCVAECGEASFISEVTSLPWGISTDDARQFCWRRFKPLALVVVVRG